MPKPAVHHLHITAGAPLDFVIKLTYYDHVYFNDRTYLFKVTKKPFKQDGYIQVNTLRKHWSNSVSFDDYLREKILLTNTSIEG